MAHLQDVMLRSDTLSPSKDQWEVDGIFAFCYKVSNMDTWTLDERHIRELKKLEDIVIEIEVAMQRIVDSLDKSGSQN